MSSVDQWLLNTAELLGDDAPEKVANNGSFKRDDGGRSNLKSLNSRSNNSESVDKAKPARVRDVSAVGVKSAAVVERSADTPDLDSDEVRPPHRSRVDDYRGITTAKNAASVNEATVPKQAAKNAANVNEATVSTKAVKNVSQFPTQYDEAAKARNAAKAGPRKNAPRTLIVFAPIQIDRDSSDASRFAQTAIGAARKLSHVSVVVIQPGSKIASTEAPHADHIGRRVDVTVTSKAEMTAAVRLILAGERLGPAVDSLPPTSTFMVIGPTTGFTKDALDSMSDACDLEPAEFVRKVIVAEPGYLTATDTRTLFGGRTNKLIDGGLHPLEQQIFRPADARTLLQGSVLFSDAPTRLAMQAAQRIADDPSLDLSSVPILQGSGLKNGASVEQIFKVIKTRSHLVEPASHNVAVKLSKPDGILNLTPEESQELNATGNALLALGLAKPLELESDRLAAEKALEAQDFAAWETEMGVDSPEFDHQMTAPVAAPAGIDF